MGGESLKAGGEKVGSTNARGEGDLSGRPGDMPGILKSSEHSNGISQLGKMAVEVKPGCTTAGGMKDVKTGGNENGTAYKNGDHGLANGTDANGTSSDALEIQRKPSYAIANVISQLPPEIEHITTGFLPLSTLIARLVQETFNGLTDVINEMSDMQVPQASHHTHFNSSKPQVNGNGAGNSNQVNVQKKLRMLEFAQNRRAQFIKLLVLSQWSRQAEEVSKVIDTRSWLASQGRIFDEAIHWMGEMKRILIPIKMPNPDIRTALEALSLGRAPRLPDLGYIPLEPLSPQQMLKALRNINTLLSIRLNLHETVPSPFRDFSIASGRATFRVPGEFEVDLSIAEENPSSQLYFIDFRFLFSPTPAKIPLGRLRDEIERKANDVLKQQGLRGCFDFFHDLVLTHKLSILRNQAYDMSRGHWSEHLKVEAVHRSLVVQYWLNRPGGRNWFEIGVKRRKGNERLYSSDTLPIPYIALRWFRGGKEVADVQVDMGLSDLCLAAILKLIIAKHTNSIFQEVAAKLREGPLYSERLLRLKQRLSAAEPIDAALFVQLTVSKAIKIIQEPVSGRFALLPASSMHARTEWELNNLVSPATDASSRIANLRAIASQEEFETRARCCGWECVRSLNINQETRARLFPRDTLRIGFFRRRAWSSNWIPALTTGLGGDSWWIIELPGKEARPEGTSSISRPPSVIRAAYKMQMPGFKSLIMEPSYATLAQIERTAAGMISQYIDTRHLTFKRIPHNLQRTSTVGQPVTLTIKIGEGKTPVTPKTPTTPQSPNRPSLPWANEIVTLTFQGIDHATSSAIHLASARMETPIPNITALTSSIDSSIAFHPTTGAFAFRLLTPVGELTIPPLVEKLSSIERLIHCLHIIKHHDLRCNAVSLDHLEFTYTTTPSALKATIYLQSETSMRISFMRGNPHLRIQDYLAALLRTSGGLNHVLRLLNVTLPLLRIFSFIEIAHGTRILPRSAEWYQVRYQGSRSRWDIRLRLRRGEVAWFIKDIGVWTEDGLEKGKKVSKRLDVDVDEAMMELERASGAGWLGMKGGMAATPEGVEELVKKMDELYRTNLLKDEVPKLASSGEKKRKRGEEDDPVVLD